MPVTLNGTNGLTFNDGSSQATAARDFGFKNRIINGAMMIDQRNAGASVATSSGFLVYSIDRWFGLYSQTSKFTMQRNAGSVTPPAGFTNYLGCTSTSAYTVGAGEIFYIRQTIEGFNIADLGWGTASASPVTLSFWVRSSLTGTFGGALQNNGATRSYPFSYTISSANTWEYKTITIAGETTGTWLTDNGVGVGVQFSLGTGSSNSGTAGSWQAANLSSATGATSVVGTNGATFYITGVQLEKGSTATSFDYRPYGTELALCQRYFEKTFPIDVAPANNLGPSSEVFFSGPQNGGGFGSNMYYSYFWKVTKRAAPTVTAFNTRSTVAGTWSTYDAGVVANTTPIFETVTVNAVSGYIQRGTLAVGSMTASSEL